MRTTRIFASARILVLTTSLGFNLAFAGAVEDLQALLDASNNQEAYSHAQLQRAEHESEPAFDLLFGTAAYRTAHYHEAMFALERVVIAEPENMNARYVLAKTYYEMGNHDAARHQFKIVQANNPPTDVAQDINNYLVGMQGKTKHASLLGYVEAYLGHDNNINQATGDSTVTLPFTAPQPLASSARQQSDMYSSVGADIQYFQPIKEDLGVIIKGDLKDKDYFSGSDFDQTVYDVGVTLNQKLNKETFKLGVNGQGYQVGGSNYSRTLGMSGSWNHELTSAYGLSAGLGYNEINYPDNNLLNVNQAFFHASVHHRYQRIYNSIGFMQTNENALHALGDHNARDTKFWFYDLNFYADSRNSIQTRFLYSKSDRDAQDPIFLDNRNDHYLSLTTMWQWRYNEQLSVNTRFGYSHNNSDINLYDYERTYLETGLRYAF